MSDSPLPATQGPTEAGDAAQLLVTLFELGREVTSVLDLDELLEKIPQLIARLTPFKAFAVWLLLYDHTYLHPDAGRGLFGLFYMIIFANALAYAAWFPVVGRLKASVASLSLLVVPCLGVASSAVLVQRAIGPFDVAALACVLGAIALVVRRPVAPLAAEETRRQAG